MFTPSFRSGALAAMGLLLVACGSKSGAPVGTDGAPGAGGRGGASETAVVAGGRGGASVVAGGGGVSGLPGTGGSTWTYGCVGTPLSCGLHLSETECVVVGCDWDRDTCSGVPRSCPVSGGSSTCTGVIGCMWSSYDSICTGSPYACSLMLDSSECFMQGCTWQPAACSGVPFACAQFTNEFACSTLAGCTWQLGPAVPGSGGVLASGGIGAGGAGGRDGGAGGFLAEPSPEPRPEAGPELVRTAPDVPRIDGPPSRDATPRDLPPDIPRTTITVVKEGAGDGAVTSAPTGISCGSTCSASFISGSAVSLNALANSSSTFAGWSGACSGTGVCTFTADMDQTVIARFDIPPATLTVTKGGAGTGTITSTPAGIDCGSSCAADFPVPTTVALSAVADAGSVFSAWSGACTGSAACSLTLRGRTSVTATFSKAQGASCTASSQCQSGFTCADGVCCTQSACPACQNCGSDGLCSVGVASAEDTTGTTCTGTSICDAAHACKAKNGGACTAPGECASGSCTDNRCCAQSCGVCQACTGAGGTCAAVTVGEDSDTCTGNNTCDQDGVCKKKDGQSCAAGSECASGGCIGNVCAEPVATGPSCAGLSKTCGPTGNQSCCTTLAVPGGTFYRSYDGDHFPDKLYPATVSGFYLDKYEVTVGRFRAFVAAGMGVRAAAPAAGEGAHPLIAGSGWSADWTTSLPTSLAALTSAIKCSLEPKDVWTDTAAGNEELPINCVSWYLAFAFCSWDGGRLPTEAELMYAAAGGSEQRAYPWGSATLDLTRASYGCKTDGISSCTIADILPVGSLPAGSGRWNHMDLAGNVWEWLLDWRTDPSASHIVPCDNCANLTPATYREIHGGSYGESDHGLLVGWCSSNTPTVYTPGQGVRCARDHL